VARERGTEVNAVLLGALAGSSALPVSAAAFRQAIEARGVAVAANLKGFDVGLGLGSVADTSVNEGVRGKRYGAPDQTDGVRGEPQGSPDSTGFDAELAALPPPVRAIVEHALPRLVDYQDREYARRYLTRLAPFASVDGAGPVVARHLATWMTYEDAIRVAQAKTRAARFARIRADARAGNAIVEVTDYLKPDLDEIWGILPHRLVAPFARWAERRWPHGRPTLGQHVRTTTVSGFLRVWLLGRLRALRPSSWRAHVEHERIDRWLAGVTRAVTWDALLAREVAQLGRLIKGYGDVRRRLVGVFDAGLALALRIGEAEARRGEGFTLSTTLVEHFRTLVLEGPDGEARALALAASAGARLDAGDLDGVRALVSAQPLAS
jgi:indolepyruvate ferredoxin oxidoreductase beta subunit